VLGSGFSCQLGDGTCDARPTPFDVVGLTSGVAGISTAGGSYDVEPSVPYVGAFINVAHTCAVTTAGAAMCWGANYCGMLGDGAAPDCSAQLARKSPVAVVGLASGVASVSAAGLFSCALLTDGPREMLGLRLRLATDGGHGLRPATPRHIFPRACRCWAAMT